MSRQAKLERYGRRHPVVCDWNGEPVDPAVTLDISRQARWQWHQLQRAERLAHGGQPRILADLRNFYAEHGTPGIQALIGSQQQAIALH